MNEKGHPRPVLTNALTAFREAPEFAGALKFDALRHQPILIGSVPWDHNCTPDRTRTWTDQDDRLATEWLQNNFIFLGIALTVEAIRTVAEENMFHPILTYLESCRWDGEPRLDEWVVKYLGVPDTFYARAVGARWMISAVARVHQPGEKADCALVLEGPQGSFKSTALRILGRPWFTDEIAAMGTKDASEQTVGVWIVELAELDAVTRASDYAHVKAFISRSTDRFRPSYGRSVKEFPRQCVFAATTNHKNWNRDETGARRLWPLACGKVDIDGLAEVRDLLWAEARDRFFAGESWWLDTSDLIGAAEVEQEDRFAQDPWEELVSQHIKSLSSVSTKEIMSMLGIPVERQGKVEAMRIGSILRHLRWERKKIRLGDQTMWRYYPPELHDSFVPTNVP